MKTKFTIVIMLLLLSLWGMRSLKPLEGGPKFHSTTNEAKGFKHNVPMIPEGSKVSIAPPSVQADFQRAQQHISKALVTKEERLNLEKYLCNEKLIGYAVEILLDSSNGAITREAETQRMRAVEFLEKALMRDANPKHDSVVQALRIVLMSSDEFLSPESQMDRNLRKSKLGDIIEVYSILYREEPSVARDLYDSAPDYIRKVYDFGISIVENKYSKVQKEGEV